MKFFIIIKKIYFFLFFFKSRVIGYKNLITQKKEIKNLEKIKKEICVIYDFKTNPLAIGNFAYLTLFARYLALKGFKIYFYVINSKKIYCQSAKEIKKKNYIFNYINSLPNVLIKKKKLESFEILDWEIALHKIKKKKIHILFEDVVLKRKYSITSYLFYLFNELLINEKKKFINNFLLSEKIFKIFSNKKINSFTKKKYLSILFRADKFNPSRNSERKEIIQIFDHIKTKYPKKNIIIISDKEGCQKARKFLKNKKNIFFSKDFSNSVYSDIYLQLKSDVCFASHRAGGMLTWHFFSKKNFCCTHHMGTQDKLRYKIYHRPNQNHSWWHKNQLFLASKRLDDLLNLIKKTE